MAKNNLEAMLLGKICTHIQECRCSNYKYTPSVFIDLHMRKWFSTLPSIKTKLRKKLDCEAYLKSAISAKKPKIKLLVSKKQSFY